MDMNQIGQLLHIHKEALAHGPMFSNIAAAAMHALREHEAEAKEEMDHLREEQAKRDAAAKEEALAQQKAQREDDDTEIVKPRMVAKEEIEPQSEPTIRRPAGEPEPTIIDRRL